MAAADGGSGGGTLNSRTRSLTEREANETHSSQIMASRQETTTSPFQRHVSFGTEVTPAASFPNAAAAAAAVSTADAGSSSSSRVARKPANAPPPLPLSEAMITSPMSAAKHPVCADGGKTNGSATLCTPQHSQSVEDHNTASLSAGASHLHFQLDDLNSPMTNNSGAPTVPITSGLHHIRYASSPYQQQISTFEDVSVASCSGAGSAGGSVNVHVRVRHHHHHTHSRTTSFFSDSTTDHGNSSSPHPHTTQITHAQAESSTYGLQPSHSLASVGSSSIVFHGAGGAASSNYAGSARERVNSGVAGNQSTHSHSHRHQIPGAASSTRSGETTSTARLMDKRSGTYRWDWRTAGLDLGEED